jgi:hypothetical protein
MYKFKLFELIMALNMLTKCLVHSCVSRAFRIDFMSRHIGVAERKNRHILEVARSLMFT